MSVVTCKNCGRVTNTAVSDHLDEKDTGVATKCYAAWEDNNWVKGCSFEEADDFVKKYIVDRLFSLDQRRV